MKIAIDFERLKYPYCGLGQYSANLALALARAPDPNLNFTYLLPAGDRGRFGKKISYLSANPIYKQIRFLLPDFDLWHCTHQDSRFGPKNRKTRLVFTIHDLNFLQEKSPSKAKARLSRLQKLVDRAEILTTVSAYSAGQIQNHLNTQGKKIEVIYNGVDLTHLENPQAERPNWAPQNPYFLALGAVSRKKNFHTLIPMMTHFQDFTLIIAGPDHDKPYAGEIRELCQRHHLEERVVLPGAVSGRHKSWLFQNCQAFLFPSLLEGFGIPVVEALCFGKPVVCSNQTCLPEIAGQHAAYWTDFDPDAMALVLQRHLQAVESDKERTQQQSIAYAKSFSWAKAASHYQKIYRTLA